MHNHQSIINFNDVQNYKFCMIAFVCLEICKIALLGDVQDSNFFSFEKCNFCFRLELCKLASLPLFMMSTLEILAPPLSLSKRREDPYINFHIMTKVSIILICASLYIQIKTYTISITLFFMHDTEK